MTHAQVASDDGCVKVAAIVVNYRTAALTRRCVDSLLPQLAVFGDYRVVVVDNASGDGSAVDLRAAVQQTSWRDHVVLIEAPRNGGLSYGINRALDVLLGEADRPELVWNMNPDAVAEPGALQALVAEMDRDPQVGIVGSRVLDMEGRVVGGAFRRLSWAAELTRNGTAWPLTSLLHRFEVHPNADAETGEVDWVPGCSLLIRRTVLDDIGWFDEGFFLYFEETDFCRRAQRCGWKVRYSVEGAVRHEGSASTGMADTTRPMPKYWFDSRRRYYRKHHSLLYADLCEAASVVGTALGVGRAWSGRAEPTRPGLLAANTREAFRAVGDWSALHPESQGGEIDSDREGAESFVDVVIEDFQTHDRDLAEPGFWALLAHRLGTHAGRTALGQVLGARMGQAVLGTAVDWIWGIHIPATTQLGRRVRIWHSGCIVLSARAIGDDVHVRHNTTLGPARGDRAPRALLPVIGARADIGAGACVLGPVQVGEGAHVGANSVVLKDVPAGTSVLGVPARPVPI